MNNYLDYIFIGGFLLLCLCQFKLWCRMFCTCGVMWDKVKSLFKKGANNDNDTI